MKKQMKLIGLFLAMSTTAFAQNAYRHFYPASRIIPYSLKTGYYKTTILIFPASISNNGIDRGSADIIAKTVPGVDNILKLKANRKGFPETNLTVVTTDGKVYSFVVDYSVNPPDAPVNIGEQTKEEEKLAYFNNQELNLWQVKSLSKSIALGSGFLNRKVVSFKIKLKLVGIYSCKDVMFYQFVLQNKSQIDYTIDFSRFYVQNKKQVKRTAQQETEIKPMYSYVDKKTTTAGRTRQTIVVAFRKFTIADHKNFVLQLFEKGGDRNPTLRIDGNEILKARKVCVPAG